MEISDVIQEVHNLQRQAKILGLEVDCWRMYSAFYEQHKQSHGSYAHLVQNYNQKMDERYSWIISQIRDVIESKKSYEVK